MLGTSEKILKNVIPVLALLLASPTYAHHSDAGLDMTSVVAFTGKVTEFAWRNPHVYVLVEATNSQGKPVKWDVQMGPINVVSRQGWTRDTLKPGDLVSVRAHASTDGRPYGIVASIDKPGGLGLLKPAGAPQLPAKTTTLSGKWIADRAATMADGGFYEFFEKRISLNEKGRAAQAAYDPLSKENPESTCVGRPTPAALVSTSLYLMEIDVREKQKLVILHSEWFDEVRTVYMDGRKHPDASKRFATGHSIGWWDGKTLVVDTRNFTDHRSPYQIGVPSGGQKHVVERYRLNDEGTRIDLEFTLEDPEYLAKPMVHSRQLMYSPQMTMYPGTCDPEATRRFVSH